MEITREVQETAMLIDGQPRPGRSGKSVEVFNPANGELVGIVPVASEADIDDAVRSSQRAFLQWRETPAAERAAIMMKVGAAVRANIEELGRILTLEQGKPFPQAKGEIGGFCGVMEFYAQEARRITGMVLPSDTKDKFVYVLRHPIGGVGASPPWHDPRHRLGRM